MDELHAAGYHVHVVMAHIEEEGIRRLKDRADNCGKEPTFVYEGSKGDKPVAHDQGFMQRFREKHGGG